MVSGVPIFKHFRVRSISMAVLHAFQGCIMNYMYNKSLSWFCWKYKACRVMPNCDSSDSSLVTPKQNRIAPFSYLTILLHIFSFKKKTKTNIEVNS